MYDHLVAGAPYLPKGVRLSQVLEGIPQEELEDVLPAIPGGWRGGGEGWVCM